MPLRPGAGPQRDLRRERRRQYHGQLCDAAPGAGDEQDVVRRDARRHRAAPVGRQQLVGARRWQSPVVRAGPRLKYGRPGRRESVQHRDGHGCAGNAESGARYIVVRQCDRQWRQRLEEPVIRAIGRRVRRGPDTAAQLRGYQHRQCELAAVPHVRRKNDHLPRARGHSDHAAGLDQLLRAGDSRDGRVARGAEVLSPVPHTWNDARYRQWNAESERQSAASGYRGRGWGSGRDDAAL